MQRDNENRAQKSFKGQVTANQLNDLSTNNREKVDDDFPDEHVMAADLDPLWTMYF